VKTTFRRLQQLEQRRSESLAADHTSGARDRLLERLKGMAERLWGDPDWESMPNPTVDEIRQRVRDAVSRHRGDRG
jgi:hypothetical protein